MGTPPATRRKQRHLHVLGGAEGFGRRWFSLGFSGFSRGVLALCLVGCSDPEGSSASGGQEEGQQEGQEEGQEEGSVDESEESGETGESGVGIGPFSEACVEAPELVSGRHVGSLRGRDQSLGGTCGLGGPQVFFAVDVASSADVFATVSADSFEPRVELLSAQCIEGRGYQCRDNATAAVYDVRGGTRVVVSVGVDPEDPGLLDAEASGDPLSFELDLEVRPVLPVGEACGSGQVGRCAAGTVCEALEGDWPRCTILPGDTCATSTTLALPAPGETLELELDLGDPQGEAGPDARLADHHRHSCAGARMPDRVYRIDRAQVSALAQLAGEHRIELTGPALGSEVGVAAAFRGPGCRLEHELACAEEISAGPLSLDPESLSSQASGDVYLFVELPLDAQGVISLSLAVVDA